MEVLLYINTNTTLNTTNFPSLVYYVTFSVQKYTCSNTINYLMTCISSINSCFQSQYSIQNHLMSLLSSIINGWNNQISVKKCPSEEVSDYHAFDYVDSESEFYFTPSCHNLIRMPYCQIPEVSNYFNRKRVKLSLNCGYIGTIMYWSRKSSM